MTAGAVVWIILMAVVIAAIVAAAVALLLRADRQFPPHRKIVNRMPATDGGGGEIITLECKHQYRLIHHNRESMPCEECRDAVPRDAPK